ncbi:MAG: hypothetical protein HGB19_00235 [Chlorobiales bacterium]|nr:hypothetical protein [Chlorobiales bacterium]
MRIYLTIFTLIMTLTACGLGGGSADTSKFKAPAGDTTAIVAGVDTLGVTKGQIEQIIHPMTMQIAQQAMQTGQNFDDLAQPLRRQLASQILLQHIMVLEAKAQGLKADPKKVDSLFNAYRSQYKDTTGFSQALHHAGETPEGLRAKIAAQIESADALEKGMAELLKITPASIDSFYAANKDHLGDAGKVKARHILKLARTPADSAKAHAAILEIAAKLAKGQDFAKLATAESEDAGSKPEGGSLGWFNPKEMIPEFAAAIAKMEPGQTSAPVRTQFGWHIIKLEERKTGAPPLLDSLRTQIEKILKSQRTEAVIPAYYRSIVKKYKVTFFDPDYRDPVLFDEPKK